MERDAPHRALYKVLLDVQNATAKVLDNTTVSDIAGLTISPDFGKQGRKAKAGEESAPSRNGRPENEPRRSRVLTLTGR
ncbi:MAG: hypothetical protein ABSC64_08880 [Candidatus Korobacteraceae bacterium]|jgi:hypothetical protein